MLRSKVILQSEFPYSVNARCINREWFNLSMPQVWNLFCEELTRTAEDRKWRIHSFVLMSNHFHLIVSTPEANISQCMHQFMTNTSRRLNWYGNRINETFAGRHFKCILQEPHYFLNTYKYNYRNPVTAGVCNQVEEYPFSTLRTLLGCEQSKIPLVPDETYERDPVGTLKWLNTPPSVEKLAAMKYGLRRQYFKSKLGTDRLPIFDQFNRL